MTVIPRSPILMCQSTPTIKVHCMNTTVHLGSRLDSACLSSDRRSFWLFSPLCLSVLSASNANSTCRNSNICSSVSAPQLRSTNVSESLQLRSRSQRNPTSRLRQSRPGATSRPPSVSCSSPAQPPAKPSAAICCRLKPSNSRCVRRFSACGPGGAQPFNPATVTRNTSRSSRRRRCSHELRLFRCWSVNDGTLSRISASITQDDEEVWDSFTEPFCTGFNGVWVKKPGGSSQLCSSSTCQVSMHKNVIIAFKLAVLKLISQSQRWLHRMITALESSIYEI